LEVDYIECGDCLELMKELPDNSVNICFTSPPYNRKRNDKYEFYDDTIEDYYKFLCNFTDEVLRITSRYIIINIQKNYYNKKEVFDYIGKYSTKITEIIIWEKSNPMPASGYNITNAYEFFIIFAKEPLKSNSTYTKNHITTSVNSNMLKEHKAVMKQEVSDWFIEKFTKENDIILDPFLGIGTTAISCVKLNRHYIGFEINPTYYHLACKRLDEVEGVRNHEVIS